MIREIMMQGVFLLMLLLIIYGNQDTAVYHQNQDLRASMGNYTRMVRSIPDFHAWLKAEFVKALYYSEDYRGKSVSSYDQKFVANTFAMRLGPPRLRQLRVTNETCEIPPPANLGTTRCTHEYSPVPSFHQRKNHSLGWIPYPDGTAIPDQLTNFEKAFMYSSSSELRGLPFWGYLATYEGGGYVANLGLTKSEAMKILQQLEDIRWIDQYTRVVFVEFNVFNMQSGLFTQIIISVEIPPTGGAHFWTDIRSVKLYRYTGAPGVIAIVTEVLCTLIFLVMTIYTIFDIVENGCKWFKSFWNWTVIASSTFFVIAASIYAYRSVWTVKSVEYMMHHWGDVANFQIVTTSDNIFLTFLGLAAYLVMMQFLHILRYNKTIAILSATVAQSAGDLLGMGFIVFIVYAAFLSLGHLMFGSRYYKYGTIKDTAVALCSNFLGNFKYEAMKQAVGVPGQVFLIVYLCTMIYLMVNLFITLLCNYMEAVKNDDSYIPKDHQVVDHFFDSLRGLVGGDDDDDDKDDKNDDDKNDPKPPISDAGISTMLFGSSKQAHIMMPKKSRKVMYLSE